MFSKTLLVVLLALALTGCAIIHKKPVTEASQPVAYQAPQRTAEPEVQQAPVTYSQPVEKAAVVEPVGKLDAQQIQTALKNSGYYKGAIDGKIGPKTRAAIKKFQKANGLKADGKVGKKTSAALGAYLTK